MARVVPKILLLDMDGVVFRQPHVYKFVSMRVVSYVQKKLKPILTDINYHYAEQINTMLYTSYGHTLIGLNSIFNTNIDMNEFNRAVYDDITLNYMRYFKYDPKVIEYSNEVRQTIHRCHEKDIPVYIFSNAPICWSNAILEATDLVIEKNNILGPEHPLFDEGGQLKPMPRLYNGVERLLCYRHGEKSEIIFMDDSISNLRPCIHMEKWKPILLNQDMPKLNTYKISLVSNIKDLEYYI
jgi:FMN phosphatase YigB (HAD superfamily)